MKFSVLLTFALIVVFGASQHLSAQNGAVLQTAEKISGDKFTYSTTTAKGARVYGVINLINKPSRLSIKG